MGLFDFLKYEKKKAPGGAEKEQAQQPAAGEAGRPSAGSAADAASATRAAAERMAAAAPPKRGPATPAPATPTPGSAAHKAVPAPPRPAAMPKPGASSATAPGALHTPTPHSAAHKAVPAAPVAKPGPTARKRTYTVKAGDSLPSIARTELGNEARWRELYAMNRGVVGGNPDLVRPGMLLTLPG
ncbi:LysM peptidoglycan-binding domain-containing protein [Streptomyces sp. NPDC087297]|uniref:LysM peptidoglycan-binding domain-containing protein n=1 Tax=Streptomyces sp. NPDC087297 TaxID=3365778 RepID=UPI003827473E